ncbi:Rieske (2Fe-2S) protein [Actinoplanes sp. KI2]|uniref:QcrA and Rieske domain-containing protein n=1 Tax=Actinoplanes sp. KI2 TaxID=2983315 RepID=UPI0021D5CF5A|nr:Rieske (2Fe-2S) protein [Actinoplanes sp. KI2]MCU7724947.1 Rieske (2Fe-2S) protein [Actinoplanes sp. KI2]
MNRVRRISAYIDRLLRQRRPGRFVPTDDEADALRAAIALRAAEPEGAMPRPEFLADLRAKVATEMARAGEAEPEVGRPPTGRRRQLLAGTAAAAGAAVVAVVVDRTVAAPTTAEPSPTLSPNDGAWHTVMASEDLAEGDARTFDTGAVTGYLHRVDGVVSARSGICTHQACRLLLNLPERRLDCPCHRTFFALDGEVIHYQLKTKPGRLPEIRAREQSGQIQVFVPRTTAD